MYRALTSSSRAVAQRVTGATLNFTRAASGSEPEAGSVSGQDAFGKREKAEETRWARRFEAEQAAKHKASQNQTAGGGGQPIGDAQAYGQQQSGRQTAGRSSQQQSGRQGSGSSSQQRLSELEAEKRRIEQQINDLKRQNS